MIVPLKYVYIVIDWNMYSV